MTTMSNIATVPRRRRPKEIGEGMNMISNHEISTGNFENEKFHFHNLTINACMHIVATK